MSKNKYYFSNSQGKIKISDMHTKHLYNAIEKLKKTSLTEFKDNKIVITIKGNETDEYNDLLAEFKLRQQEETHYLMKQYKQNRGD